MENDLKNDLLKKYRIEMFEEEDIDINEMNDLIPDNELKAIFGLNLVEMLELINKKTIDKDKIRKLLVADINFYKIAKKRGITLHGTSFLTKIANVVDYDSNKLYAVLNVGEYQSMFGKR